MVLFPETFTGPSTQNITYDISNLTSVAVGFIPQYGKKQMHMASRARRRGACARSEGAGGVCSAAEACTSRALPPTPSPNPSTLQRQTESIGLGIIMSILNAQLMQQYLKRTIGTGVNWLATCTATCCVYTITVGGWVGGVVARAVLTGAP